jgi:CBS domain-containing protein
MTAIVKEIMNAELFSVRAGDTVESALDGILALQVTAAPVLDAHGRPLGVVSMRDLVATDARRTAGERMTAPAAVVLASARISDAARLLGETGYRHLVVVDEEARAVGIVSAVDLVRALVGLPVRHPATFPHLDRSTGLSWTDDEPLDADHVEAAPSGPGLLVLVHDGVGVPARVVWVESSANVRTRLLDLIGLPQEDVALAYWLVCPGELRFRAAPVADTAAGAALADRLLLAGKLERLNPRSWSPPEP